MTSQDPRVSSQSERPKGVDDVERERMGGGAGVMSQVVEVGGWVGCLRRGF